jgi:serine/threonine protein kinase
MFPYLNYSNDERRNYFIQICLGVLALHESEPPIIHRDLKPRNILVFQDPEERSTLVLKVADFGLSAIAGDSSHLTTSGQTLGTGSYMAPALRSFALITKSPSICPPFRVRHLRGLFYSVSQRAVLYSYHIYENLC